MTSIQVLINNFPEGASIKVNDGIIPTATPTPVPEPTPAPTPGPTPTPVPSNFDYIIEPSTPALNSILSSKLTPGKKVLLKNGNYTLNEMIFPPNVSLIGESHNAIITANSAAPYLIHLQSNSLIQNIRFNNPGKTKTIFVSGKQTGWKVDSCYFQNSTIAVIAEDLDKAAPSAGHGWITNNIGIGSKLFTLQGQTNVTITGNDFRNRNGSEFADFNYNIRNCLMENNKLINSSGFHMSEEVIDMVGGNGTLTTGNIVRNNTIIGNFRTGIRPSLSTSNNTIEGNTIEWLPGPTTHIGNIYLYGKGSTGFSRPNGNKIRNNTLKGGRVGIEMSGAETNTITGNNISGCEIGIDVLDKTIYGDAIPCTGNNITDNTISNIGYGIYMINSPDNTFSPNNITNWSKGKTFGI